MLKNRSRYAFVRCNNFGAERRCFFVVRRDQALAVSACLAVSTPRMNAVQR
jgi:hypothetical protein